MKLGVSAWRLNATRFGVARYTDYLVSAMSRQLTPNDSITLFAPTPILPQIKSQGAPIYERTVGPRLTNALWENLILPFNCRDMDVLFGPSYTLPIFGSGKKVVCIHSVNEAEKGQHSFWYNLTYGLKYRLSAKVADRVIVNSQSNKDRVVNHYGISPDKVDVIWLGVDDKFKPLEDDQADTILRHTRVRYIGEDRPYVLFVGTMSARRNIPTLIKAFAKAKKQQDLPHALFLVGQNKEGIPIGQLARDAGVEDSVVHFGGTFENHGGIIPIYNAADLFVMPANTEGFSLTLPEAMACGVPAITSASSSLGEVANGYAHTLDHIDEENLSAAIAEVLTDRQLHKKLKERGLERAKELRWDKCAKKTLAVLRQVAES
ncbi:glycosyltransferase family 4 protein [Marinobacter panjinensis]|nr:glycosyltransferase family 1 protein [Marinobacter panjinensis]MCR8915764.1 glycosyltransferase family 4 protein [Marinobacter panjinensis]